MATPRKIRVGLVLGGLLFLGAVILLVQPGAVRTSRLFLRWVVFDTRLKLSLEQDAAGPSYYGATAKGPVALAGIVREFRVAWPEQGVDWVHASACEVATALLHHGDVEVGDFDGTKFVPWRMPRWVAAEKISAELRPMPDFLEDAHHYVFRRK